MAPLLAGNPDVQQLLNLRSRRAPYLFDASQRRLVAALRAMPPCPVYVCDHHMMSKLRWLLARAGIPAERCMYVADFQTDTGIHWVDLWLEFGESTPAAYAGTIAPSTPVDRWLAPRLFVADADRADCARWLQTRGFHGHPVILLQPGNKRTLKRGRLGQFGNDKAWPVARWAALAATLSQQTPDARVLLCGAPPEAALLSEIQVQANSAAVHVAAEDLPLRRLLALCEVAQAMVSVDTGPAHIAAALGCPLIVLYGDAPPRNWLPRSASGSEVIPLGGPPVSERVDAIALDDVLAVWNRLTLRASANSHSPPPQSY
jgi:heptosyltransferase-2/heptosyltransferase-3